MTAEVSKMPDRAGLPVVRYMEKSLVTPHTLGEALTMLVRRTGKSAERIAEESDMGRTSITGYLNDQRVPAVNKLVRLTDVLASHLRVDPRRLRYELMDLIDFQESLDVAPPDGAPLWFMRDLGFRRELARVGYGEEVQTGPCVHPGTPCVAHILLEIDREAMNTEEHLLSRILRLAEDYWLHSSVEPKDGHVIVEFWPRDGDDDFTEA